jgi:hypothetical protein
LADGFIASASPAEGDAQAVVGLGETRLQAERFLKMQDGLVDLVSLVQGGTEIGVSRGIVRLESQGFLKLTDGLVASPLSGEGNAQVVMALGVVRSDPSPVAERDYDRQARHDETDRSSLHTVAPTFRTSDGMKSKRRRGVRWVRLGHGFMIARLFFRII